MTSIEVHFKQEPEPDDPERLRIEHFLFPLGLWFVGTLISILFFTAEIIVKRIRKTKTEVPREIQPGVIEVTP